MAWYYHAHLARVSFAYQAHLFEYVCVHATTFHQCQLIETQNQIKAFLDRIVEATTKSVVNRDESSIEELEREVLILRDKLDAEVIPIDTQWDKFELAMRFFSSPWNIWENGQLEDRITVVKLTFSSPPIYYRTEGFRTPKTSILFSVLGKLDRPYKAVAEGRGFEPRTPFGEHDFQSCALSHSAIPPQGGSVLAEREGGCKRGLQRKVLTLAAATVNRCSGQAVTRARNSRVRPWAVSAAALL